MRTRLFGVVAVLLAASFVSGQDAPPPPLQPIPDPAFPPPVGVKPGVTTSGIPEAPVPPGEPQPPFVVQAGIPVSESGTANVRLRQMLWREAVDRIVSRELGLKELSPAGVFRLIVPAKGTGPEPAPPAFAAWDVPLEFGPPFLHQFDDRSIGLRIKCRVKTSNVANGPNGEVGVWPTVFVLAWWAPLGWELDAVLPLSEGAAVAQTYLSDRKPARMGCRVQLETSRRYGPHLDFEIRLRPRGTEP